MKTLEERFDELWIYKLQLPADKGAIELNFENDLFERNDLDL